MVDCCVHVHPFSIFFVRREHRVHHRTAALKLQNKSGNVLQLKCHHTCNSIFFTIPLSSIVVVYIFSLLIVDLRRQVAGTFLAGTGTLVTNNFVCNVADC